MKCKVYVSDIGWGHLVRQQAIASSLVGMEPDLQFVLQTEKHLDSAKWIFDISKTEFISKFNNISWAMQQNGEPDLLKIKSFFLDYETRSQKFIADEAIGANCKYDFLLSDFVFEAFPIAAHFGIPSFGVAHFTWDWFFSKMFPVPVDSKILRRFRTFASAADILFFPEFTPEDILRHYKGLAQTVPLIVREPRRLSYELNNKAFNVLVMDSGAGVLRQTIEAGLRSVTEMDDVCFYVSAQYEIESKNIQRFEDNRLLADLIPAVDLVVSRGGFNVISECIASRTPILMVGEALNPEIDINMLAIKKLNLGSFISAYEFTNAFDKFLGRFLKHEYPLVLRHMSEHEIRVDGADVIASKILNHVR